MDQLQRVGLCALPTPVPIPIAIPTPVAPPVPAGASAQEGQAQAIPAGPPPAPAPSAAPEATSEPGEPIIAARIDETNPPRAVPAAISARPTADPAMVLPALAPRKRPNLARLDRRDQKRRRRSA